MSQYIDGFVFPIAVDSLEAYKRVADKVAMIYREHGALDYCEYVAEDMQREGTRAFPEMVGTTEQQTIVFGWITYDSRKTRDIVNERVEADPRIGELVAPLLDSATPIFQPSQMAFGGFQHFVGSADSGKDA